MNDAHLHLIVNHFPIIGLFFGLGVLVFGIVKKNKTVLNIAYVMFIICMIFSKVSMFTGEKAEEIVEKMNISHEVIHEHEETAETFMKLMYALAIGSILGLYNNNKNKPRYIEVSFGIAVVALIAISFSVSTGISGGEIRHTEIRSDAVTSSQSDNHDNNFGNEAD